MTTPMTFDELGTLPLVRCKTCGEVLGNLYNRFIMERDLYALADSETQTISFTTPAERAFDKLNILNDCCRHNLTNPPRIPIGGYFYKPENIAPNTYIMGEYGKNYGDPKVLDELNNTMTEEGKRSLIKSGLAPIYRKTVSAGSQRYGNKFQPTLQELFAPVIVKYVNFNVTEMEMFRKGLWNLFLYAMYARGWKGPGYAYPTKSSGLPDLKQLLALLDEMITKIRNNESIMTYPSSEKLKNLLRLFYTYIGSRIALYDRTIFFDMIDGAYDPRTEIDPNLIVILEYTKNSISDNLTMLPIAPDEFLQPNIFKMDEHFHAFTHSMKYTDAILQTYRMINSINVNNGTPVKQTMSLHFRVAQIQGNNLPISDAAIKQLRSNDDIFNYARIIAISCYYILDLISGNKIVNFFPTDISASESGISFTPSPLAYVPYVTEQE